MMRRLLPYIWPSGRPDLRRRIYAAFALLLAAKLVTIAVPFSFKWATDSLVAPARLPSAGLLAAPVALTLALWRPAHRDGAVHARTRRRFRQCRDARRAAARLATFVHMHELSLRFHLERKTGGLTRVLERGRNAIETIVRMVILQLAPTIIELSLIVGVLMWKFDWRYVLAIMITVAVYMTYTYHATEWRIGIRRRMNESDTDANVKAIDCIAQLRDGEIFRRRATRSRAL